MGAYDAIVVGARCAGSVLAMRLAGAGWRVLLVDRATFPSDTLSTHFLFPNTLQRLETLGVMGRLRACHDIPRLLWGWRVLGHQVAGAFTPIAGEDRLTFIRRITLDAALVEEALAARVVGRFGERVSGVVGTGRPGDPVRGVVLAGGEGGAGALGVWRGRPRLDGRAGAGTRRSASADRGSRVPVRLLDGPPGDRVVPDGRKGGPKPGLLPV